MAASFDIPNKIKDGAAVIATFSGGTHTVERIVSATMTARAPGEPEFLTIEHEAAFVVFPLADISCIVWLKPETFESVSEVRRQRIVSNLAEQFESNRNPKPQESK